MTAALGKTTSFANWSAVLSLAIFGWFNLLVGFINPWSDANAVWLSWAQVNWAGPVLIFVFGLAVLGWSRWRASPKLAPCARAVVATVAVGAWGDSVSYWAAVHSDQVQTSLAVPLSFGVALLLTWWSLRPPKPSTPAPASRLQLPRRALVATSVLASAALWVLLIIQCTGATSYARQSDAIVVLGARVYEDGKASLALEDRVRTACELYERGLAAHIVMSGGWADDAPLSEPEVMRALAEAQGVPSSAIILDLQGINTRRTIDALKSAAHEHHWERIIAVTHDYHCSRVWLAARQAGLKVLTVPAIESRTLRGKTKFIAREVLAWGWYWLAGSTGLL